MRLRRVHLVVALTAVTAFAACTLNPQPLPPGDPPDDNGATSFLDSGSYNASDAAARTPDEQGLADGAAVSDDSGPSPPPSDGGLTDADAADADAGDADASLPN